VSTRRCWTPRRKPVNTQIVEEPPVVVVPELVKIAEQTGLAELRQHELVQAFGPSFVAYRDLVAQSKAIVVTDATQVSEMKAAREARIKLQKVRTGADKLRKALKEESLSVSKGIENVAQSIIRACEVEEERLEKAEKFAERAEAARREKNKATRTALLAPFGVNTSFYDLAGMSEEAFAELLSTQELAAKARAEEAKRQEDQRVEAERQRREEQERIAAENKRLREEREALEAKARKEREELEAAAAKEREAAAAKQRELQRAADEERAKAAEIERKAKAEREAAEAKERARLAEEKRIADEKAAAEHAAALAPDREKLLALADAFGSVAFPQASSEAGQVALLKVKGWQAKMVAAIKSAAEGLV